MKFTAKFNVPKLDLQGYKQAAHRFFCWQLAQAARAWLYSTADTLPVYGGASKATFGPLASYAEHTLEISPVGPNTVSIGAMNGTAEFKTDPNGKYQFTYYTTLPHLIINEYNNANTFLNPKTNRPYFHLRNPGPYHFQDKGKAAFLRSMEAFVMPGVGPFIVVQRIEV